MTQPTYTISSLDSAQLHADISESIPTQLLGINADGTSVTCVFAVDPLPNLDKIALDALVAAHAIKPYGFDKNYLEMEYGKSNRLERETWWSESDGAGGHLGRVEETIYTYAGGKSNTLLTEVITSYDRSGNVVGTPITYVYSTKNSSGGKKSIIRGRA